MSDATWPTHEWAGTEDGHACTKCEEYSVWWCDRAAHKIGMSVLGGKLLDAIEHPERFTGEEDKP